MSYTQMFLASNLSTSKLQMFKKLMAKFERLKV